MFATALSSLALLGATFQSPPPAQVRVVATIDFGPIERPALRRELALERGSTAVDAARALAEVEQDWLCCSKDDVWSIGGVGPDARRDRYWSWTLGGRGGPALPAKYALEDGDEIGWKYGGSMKAVRLEERVVSLLPAATEIVIAVGGESALVGLSHLCPQPEGRELPRVLSTPIDSERWSMGEIDARVREASAKRESLYALDEELVRELAPTLVLSQGLCPVCAATPETVEGALGKHGETCAKLLVLSPHSLADVARDIREVGAAIGRKNAALVAARDFERRFEKLRALPEPSRRPRVAVIEWFEPLWVSGEWIAEMVEAAGGTPVLAGAKDSSRRVEWSELAAADPDVIVLAACSMDVERASRELGALRSRDEWRGLGAVKSSRVFLLDGERHTSTPGPRLAEGAELLAEILRAPDAAVAPSAAAWKRVTGD
jgi:iron complex transport system substrate-binding protein